MKGVEKVVYAKKLFECPNCGLACTMDATVRVRPAPGQVPIDDDKMNKLKVFP